MVSVNERGMSRESNPLSSRIEARDLTRRRAEEERNYESIGLVG
jgi:hypothetical protein